MNALSPSAPKRMAHRRKASRIASACRVSMLRVAALRSTRACVVNITQDGEAAKVNYLHNAAGQRVFKSEPKTAQTLPSETELGTGFVDWLKKNFGWLYATAQTNATIGTAYSYGEASIPSWALLGEYGNGGASSSGRTEYIWLPTDDGQAIPVGMFRSNRYYQIHSDHLGTPRLVKDDSAKPVWQWSYSAFGDNKPSGILKATTNPNSAVTNEPSLLAATSVGTALNLRFPGQYADSETGQFYNYYRNYLASQGRYTQNDPIGFAGGLSRFGYVEGNPINNIDPLGLWCVYVQSTGRMVCVNDRTGKEYYDETGYSGTGTGRNNPSANNQSNVGPIPTGSWQWGSTYDSRNTGPNTTILNPLPGNSCFGTDRDCSTFRAHGNNSRNDASQGCIVLPSNRTKIPRGETVHVIP